MIFSLRYRIFKVIEKRSKGKDKIIKDVLGLLVIDMVAFLQHPGIDLDDFLFGSGHIFDCDKSEHIDTLLGNSVIDLHGVVEVALVELGTEMAQKHSVVAADPRSQHFIEFEEIVELLYH